MAKEAVAKDVGSQRRGPLSVVPKFEQELERFFGDRLPRMFDSPLYPSLTSSALPKVDVVDREDEVVVRAELPGFSKKEIDVALNDSVVTIKAAHETESKDKEEDYFRREISRSYVSRTVALPAEVNGEKARAKFKDGILELCVPKVAKSKRQKVEIEG